MTKRYRPSASERDAILEKLRARRDNRAPLTPNTENKIVSLFNHITKTLNKSDITKDDLITFYNTSRYSIKTIGWANSILRGYFDLDVPSADEIGREPAPTTVLTDCRVVESLRLMQESIRRGSGHVASFVAVLVSLLTSHKSSAILTLVGDEVATLVANGGVDSHGIAFTLLPHLSHLQVDGQSLVAILSDVAASLDPQQRLENSQSLLTMCAGGGIAYSDFYKYSREALRTYMSAVPEGQQHFAQELLELERTGFKGRGTVYDYTKWLLSEIAAG